jgi:hypothetical protein
VSRSIFWMASLTWPAVRSRSSRRPRSSATSAGLRRWTAVTRVRGDPHAPGFDAPEDFAPRGRRPARGFTMARSPFLAARGWPATTLGGPGEEWLRPPQCAAGPPVDGRPPSALWSGDPRTGSAGRPPTVHPAASVSKPAVHGAATLAAAALPATPFAHGAASSRRWSAKLKYRSDPTTT